MEVVRTLQWLTVTEALRTLPWLTVAAVVDMQVVAANMQAVVVAADTAAAVVGAKQPAQQTTSGEAPASPLFLLLQSGKPNRCTPAATSDIALQ